MDSLIYLDIISKIITIIANVVAAVGVWIAIIQYKRLKKKEIRDREYGTYNALDEKYLEFQKLCLEHSNIDVFDIKDDKPKVLKKSDEKQELILFTILISIFERAYLLYSDQNNKLKKKQWEGWDTYIQGYCKRENFLNAWKQSGHTFDTDFEQYMHITIKKSTK